MMAFLSNLPIIMMAVFVGFMGFLIITSDESDNNEITEKPDKSLP